ncbi:MAG TPA: alanine dehydrogenase [Armatimonadota bacterium]|nr:alanine dehydrogenase [Armatimonadota bacterium]
MLIGVPRETKDGEKRVAITPAGVTALRQHGHEALVEAGAGRGSGYEDEDYCVAGGAIAATADAVWARAEVVLKVKEPLPSEYARLRPELVLFTYLHLASSEPLTRALLDSGVTAIGYETVQTDAGALPLLVPMSEIAGKMSVQIGARYLEADFGGRGVLVGGVPGVPPAEVVIIGCGVVGINAAKVAMGLGAHVTILDVDHERLRYLDDIMHGNVITVYSNSFNIARAAGYADLLVGAVLVAGARAPKLVTADMVRAMKRGAVIVDVAVDQGGCVETIRPTSHSQPTYVEHGVIHYGVPNIPAAVPRTATHALTNATLPYVLDLADYGLDDALARNPALARGLNLRTGEIIHPAVAEAFNSGDSRLNY